jgi:ComF family protein
MNTTEKTVRRLGVFLELCADILFPKKAAVRRLEMMSASEILASVAKAGSVEKTEFIALFRYHDPLAKKIVWEIKYRGNVALANTVGQILCEKILHAAVERCLFGDQLFGPHKKVLIVPIPISAQRLKHRGFSQTELISTAVIENIPKDLRESFLYCPNILVKIKETPSQASLGSRADRLSNLSGAFGFANTSTGAGSNAADLIRGKNIILIDDVITTGTTMKETSGVLLDAGAKSVTGFGIAH